MKYKLKLFTFLLVYSLLYSCENDIKNHCNYTNKSNNGNIEIKDQLTIKIDSTNNYMSYQTIVKGDSLIRANSFTSTIDVFSIKERKKKNSYHFKQQGPNSITRFNGAGIVPLEKNTFLIGTLSGEVYKTNKDSVIYKKILSDVNKFSGKEYWLYGKNPILPIRIGNDVYFHKSYPFLQEEKEQYYNQKILVKYNYEQHTIEELEVQHPKEYHIGLWSFAHVHPSFTLNNNSEIIISFPINSSLYIYGIKNNFTEKVEKCVKSKYDKKPVENIKSTTIEFYEENKFIKGQVRYLNITYDKVNNIYYRLVALPVENDMDLTSKDKAFLVSPLVIMVLDAEFNVLAEKKLEPYMYNYKDYFVNEEGFWLSNNNPKNPNFNEDELSFSLFSLKK